MNLLPKEQQKEIKLDLISKKVFEFWVWVVVSFAVFFTMIFVVKIFLDEHIQGTQEEIYQSEEILNSSDYKELQAQVTELNRSLSEINNLRKQQHHWSVALKELDKLIPAEVQLDQAFLNRATGRVDINGTARDRDQVIALWSNVIKSEYFKDINFPLANLEEPEDASFNFTFFVDLEKIKQP